MRRTWPIGGVIRRLVRLACSESSWEGWGKARSHVSLEGILRPHGDFGRI